MAETCITAGTVRVGRFRKREASTRLNEASVAFQSLIPTLRARSTGQDTSTKVGRSAMDSFVSEV